MGWSPQVTAVPVTPGMEEMGQRAISIMQLSPAVPWRFLAQSHAGCPCAKAHSGQRPEEVLDFSLQHLYPSLTMGMLWPGRWKGLVCLGRPGRGNLLQALALSNVINENKSDKKKSGCFVYGASFSVCPGGEEELRTVTCQKLNVCLEIRMLH